ncbi:hypothetical protein TNCT_631811 [Trichonephila clavata]|uniref:Uncharacterized protein n=1 Tax=Trichonephila clavata TaxID=2740835 RepID=A0A8X6HA36_TRICU|nr:hypothetical protein TNCT_631811 [Trichonephila clavata]
MKNEPQACYESEKIEKAALELATYSKVTHPACPPFSLSTSLRRMSYDYLEKNVKFAIPSTSRIHFCEVVDIFFFSFSPKLGIGNSFSSDLDLMLFFICFPECNSLDGLDVQLFLA